MTNIKRRNTATCCGGLGASICTLSMTLPVIMGTAGAATSAIGSMNGMPSPGQEGGYWRIIAGINAIGPPLLIVSIVVILYGMRHFGERVLTLAAIGGLLLFASMYLLSMSLPLVAIASLVLASAYAVAYAPFIRGSLAKGR